MTVRASQLARLTVAELEPAVQMLVRAFHGYPLMRHFLPSERTRPQLLARCLRYLLRYGLAYGEVYASSPEIEGIAMWLPGEQTRISLWSLVRGGAVFLPFTVGIGVFLPFTVGIGFVRRFLSFYEQIAAYQERHATERHWYLQFLGVDPVHQRKGHASRLLETMLERLDQEHLPCFLDTEDERDVQFYERFGFRTLEAGKVRGTEVGCWFMGRLGAEAETAGRASEK